MQLRILFARISLHKFVVCVCANYMGAQTHTHMQRPQQIVKCLLLSLCLVNLRQGLSLNWKLSIVGVLASELLGLVPLHSTVLGLWTCASKLCKVLVLIVARKSVLLSEPINWYFKHRLGVPFSLISGSLLRKCPVSWDIHTFMSSINIYSHTLLNQSP